MDEYCMSRPEQFSMATCGERHSKMFIAHICKTRFVDGHFNVAITFNANLFQEFIFFSSFCGNLPMAQLHTTSRDAFGEYGDGLNYDVI